MAAPRVNAAGGFAALAYVLEKGRQAGYLKLYRRLRSKNACKTCALGMGGAEGGMVNEAGHFPEVCKKSVQAQAGDMARAIDARFFAEMSIDRLEQLSSLECEALGRLAFPIILRPGERHFQRIGWDAALDMTGAALAAAPRDEAFFYVSGRSSNEAAFLLQLVARAYGTANIHNCSYYCHQASGVALGQVYGSGTASVVLDDLARADLAVVIGANPASNHPRLITQLVSLKERGGKVLVINPLRELGLLRFRVPSMVKSMLFGSEVADLYLQPHIGGDVALLVAILKGLVEQGRLDEAFIGQHTIGWDEVAQHAARTSWDELVQASGVSRAEIDAAVHLIGQSSHGIMMWAMGLTHHVNGVDNVLALANVALARGWLGRPGTGLLPIRGHSNVQGVGSMGVTPALKDAFAARLLDRYGIDARAAKGMDTYASMVAAHEGRIQASVQLGGNLFGSNPDRAWAAEALQRIPLTLAVTTKLNEGHFHGRGQTMIVVPCLARDEEAQATSQESMFNYVRLSEGGEPSIQGDLKSEVEIVAALAERILPQSRFDWSGLRSHAALREEIAAVVPGFEAITGLDGSRPNGNRHDRDRHLGQDDREHGEHGRHTPGPGSATSTAPSDAVTGRAAEFQIAGRTFHQPAFGTDDGRAHFHVTPLPALGGEHGLGDAAEFPFRLMTLRSEGQFNTVVYEEEDLYRGNAHRHVVMLSAADAESLGLAEGDPVTVRSAVGAMRVEAAIVDIRAGNLAMYYPEANALVPRILDPRSKTPAFKNVAVRLEVP